MSDRALRLAAAVLALAGAAIAGYLTWAHYAHETVACPIGGGGCETVQESRYAELAGVPVALLGLALYVAVLGLLAWDAPQAPAIVAALTLAGLAFGLYLFVVQVAVIDAICAWCVANDVVIGRPPQDIGTWRSTRGSIRSRISVRLSPVAVMPWLRKPITACAGSGSCAISSATDSASSCVPHG